jgi:hypothetical protein
MKEALTFISEDYGKGGMLGIGRNGRRKNSVGRGEG